ncbi:MAG: amidohydrolase family protein [Anaerohalosphaera sp.]|nr:amidohydrolase family protein [Anaerohalosphaera sp.]
MITDFHTHLMCPMSDLEVAGHIEACSKTDACVVLGRGQGDSADINKELGRYVKQQAKMVGFGVFNPVEDRVGVKSIKAITKDVGLCGVVLYCCEQGFHPAHSRAMRFYEAAQQLGLAVFFHNCGPRNHTDVLEYGRPYLLDEIAIRFPDLKMIIGAMGVPFVAETISMIGKHDNVYADLTVRCGRVWEIYEMIVRAHEADVMGKLLFGSGYPEHKADECIETLLGFNRMMADTHLPGVPREELRGIIERDSLAAIGIANT